jgi:2-keto-4-pentenoate hydratase/2-oxohepta-3-ene-1,7-dioic acid hydratase in catechol pathway
MRLQRLGEAGRERVVVEVDGVRYDLGQLTQDIDGDFFAAGGLRRVRDLVAAGTLAPVQGADALRVGAPIGRPGKIVCVGLNYRDHVAETGQELPEEPMVFMKDPSTIVGPNDDLVIPRGGLKTDWEVELGVVIGREAHYLGSEEEAWDAIAGFVLANDVSERAFQKERGGSIDKGKNAPTFAPLGPWFVPRDEIADPQSLAMRTWVDGELRQDGTSADMIFGVRTIVHHLSQFMVLHPGELVLTGTPAGVAAGMAEPAWLRAGQRVEMEIDGLGRIDQRCAQA